MMGTAKTARLIGPPLVVQVKQLDVDGNEMEMCNEALAPFLFCKLTLVKESGIHGQVDPSDQVTGSGSKSTDQLAYNRSDDIVGNPISNSHCLTDLDDSRGMFFIWPELGVRFVGKVTHPASRHTLSNSQYHLRAMLVDLSIDAREFPVSATLDTGPFEIVSPNAFPGVFSPTELSLHFLEQDIPFKLKDT